MIDTFTYNVYYKTNYKPLYLEVEIEYEPPQIGSREYGTGLQLEPDYPEDVYVISAKLKGVDVVDILIENILDEIKEYYLEELKEKRNDTAYFD